MSTPKSKRRRSRNRFCAITPVSLPQGAFETIEGPENGTNESEILCTHSPVHGSAETDTEGIEDLDLLQYQCMSDTDGCSRPELNEYFEIAPAISQNQLLAVGQSSSTLVISNWRVIWGLLMTGGTMKMTKPMYQAMRTVSDTFASIGKNAWRKPGCDNVVLSFGKQHISSLPHFSTLHRVFKPLVLNTLAPRSEIFHARLSVKKAGARPSSFSPLGEPLASVRTVLPSEYARADLATGPVFAAMCSTSLGAGEFGVPLHTIPKITANYCVDILPIVAARRWFHGEAQSVSVDADSITEYRSTFCEKGDVVRVDLVGRELVHPQLLRSFPVSEEDASRSHIIGVVTAVWNVHHSSRRNLSEFTSPTLQDLSQRDKTVYNRLSFVSYRSPTASVQVVVPDIPNPDAPDEFFDQNCSETRRRLPPSIVMAMKARRAALKERKEQMTTAWRDWSKPLLKPGDVVLMIRPQSCENDANLILRQSAIPPYQSSSHTDARVCIVHRFWAEKEERRRHMLFIPSEADFAESRQEDFEEECSFERYCARITVSRTAKYRDVSRLRLVCVHEGRRGIERCIPITSMGTLDNGEHYFIYRFLLFWDGFQITSGKSASGNGFYLLGLNLPLHARTSASAVRILGLTPPGVDPSVIFDRIQQDLITGMTEGFLDYDAKGQLRRIFLDMVGCIGDTPALNSEIDVMGHNANAFCHICRVERKSLTLVGSRYVRSGFHGGTSGVNRSFYCHCAVRDCGASEETCRLVGIKLGQSETELPVHTLRKAMMQAKDKIPTVRNGETLLEGILDPYKACLIAPDHLLTGHARDCLNFTFKVLPSRQHRVACEAFLIRFIADCKFPLQNRLFDHEKKQLFSMSMSELYSLCMVAEIGFMKGFEYQQYVSRSSAPMDDTTRSAIQLTGSLARLIADMWWLPKLELDGKDAVQLFESNNGQTWLSTVQERTIRHLDRVRKVCAMTDSDVNALSDPKCDKRKKNRLLKEHASALLAIRTLDKPNLHRLQEFAFTTLPMVGHASQIGELVLEKAHQNLKRGLRQSNNKDPHLQSMNSVCMNDWQGRLTLLARAAIEGDESALFGCCRLLSGRESIFRIGGVISSEQRSATRDALGPDSCVSKELESQAMTVISRHSYGSENLIWKLECNVESVANPLDISTAERQRVCECVRSAFHIDISNISLSQSISSSSTNGSGSRRFDRGDVLQSLCLFPRDLSKHFPFVVQSDVVSQSIDSLIPSAPVLWCVVCFVKVARGAGTCAYYAAVWPCQEIPSSTEESPYVRCPKYKVKRQGSIDGEKFSLLKISALLRRVAVLHDCQPGQCKIVPPTGHVVHLGNTLTLDGSPFYLKARREGYPPRSV